jgi:hypothetical protein
MKLKNKVIDMEEGNQQYEEAMAELHFEAHMAMLKAAEVLTDDQIKTLCYLTGLNSSDYIGEKK